MPQVDLSALDGQALRRLLDSTRSRGDAASAYQILREMAARRDARIERPLAKRRAAEPRLVSIDLGDPMETDELPPMPSWRPPERAIEPPLAAPAPTASVAVAAPEPVDVEPALPPVEPPEPLILRGLDLQSAPDAAADPEDDGLRLGPEELPSLRPRPRARLRVAAGFAVGAASGLALGWWAASLAHDAPWRPAAPLQTASATPRPPPVPAVMDVAVAEPTPDLPPPAHQPDGLSEAPASPVETAQLDSLPPEPATPAARNAEPVQTAELAEPAPERSPAVAAGACSAQPTPADREICADPALQRLQRDLRDAYAEALDAHEDRALLRQRQLAWRDARSTVSDPTRLARLYEQRIQKLHAAAAEARAQR